MIIIAIDPGYDRCGIAVLEKEHGEEKVLAHEVLWRQVAPNPGLGSGVNRRTFGLA